MTPREVLTKTLDEVGFFYPTLIQETIDDILAALRANGLFIGPLMATEEMLSTSGYQDAGEVWADFVAEWQRGEGA